MGKKVNEFVTHWGPSINDWSEGEKRWTTERDEDLLRAAAKGGRKMDKISLEQVLGEGVVTGDYPADALTATLESHFGAAA